MARRCLLDKKLTRNNNARNLDHPPDPHNSRGELLVFDTLHLLQKLMSLQFIKNLSYSCTRDATLKATLFL